MKVTLDREDMVRALSLLAGAVPRRWVLKSLGCVLVEAGDGTDDTPITLTVTDGEVSVRSEAENVWGDVQEPGKVLVLHRPFLELLRVSDESMVDLETDETGRAVLRYGTTINRLETEEAGLSLHESFGKSFDGQSQQYSIPADPLVRGMEWASSCASRDDNRPLLATVCIQSTGTSTHFVGTDGYRMAACTLDGHCLPPGEEILIPNTSLVRAWRVYRGLEIGPDDMAEIRVTDRSVLFSFPGSPSYSMNHRLARFGSGYVSWRDVVSAGYAMRLTLNLDVLVDKLKLAMAVARHRGSFYKVVFMVDVSSKSMTLFTRVEGEIDMSVSMDIDAVEVPGGVVRTFTLNSYWLYKAIRTWSGSGIEQVRLDAQGDDKPFIFRPIRPLGGDGVWSDIFSFQMPMVDEAMLAHAHREAETDMRLVGSREIDGDDSEL